MKDGPLCHPTPSGIIEPISIFRARAENIDEPCVKAIIRQNRVDAVTALNGALAGTGALLGAFSVALSVGLVIAA